MNKEIIPRISRKDGIRVIITQPIKGICHMQVCVIADASDEEILEVCNKENPSGTENGWVRVIREGTQGPRQCNKYSDRLHILAVC